MTLLESATRSRRDANGDDVLLAASNIVKGYHTVAGYIPVLQGLDVEVRLGEMLAIVGASGVGKSTLLHVLGTLDRPESGEMRLAGRDVLRMSEKSLREFRNRSLGFVFQMHHLLPEFSALENVMMPLLIGRRPAREARERAREILIELGLDARLHHRPSALSGGEQQRVAVARALAGSPRALMADEPTGNLDQETGTKLHEMLRRLNHERGVTMVVVTHNETMASACHRILRLERGRLRPVKP
ncbi:MAG: ABC transporter ATP-binding protein [Vicinamibacteria bacterium]|nr:ABC transporter ATP-binding protein [Vicinamibacteria bacterium]